MSMDQEKAELQKLYEDYYMAGFKNNDVDLINKIISYPFTHLKDGAVNVCDTFPVDPARLKAEKGWDHSAEWQFHIPAINNHQAHAIASVNRYRADGSLIEHVHALYDFKKVDGAWKMHALAEINF